MDIDSMNQLKKLAESGVAGAQCLYGKVVLDILDIFNRDILEPSTAYQNWYDADRREKMGLYCLERIFDAEKQGYSEAIYIIGTFYEHGILVKQNYKEAGLRYQECTKHGYTLAAYKMGEFVANGHYFNKNNLEAAEWYKQYAAKIVNKLHTEDEDCSDGINIKSNETKKRMHNAVCAIAKNDKTFNINYRYPYKEQLQFSLVQIEGKRYQENEIFNNIIKISMDYLETRNPAFVEYGIRMLKETALAGSTHAHLVLVHYYNNGFDNNISCK